MTDPTPAPSAREEAEKLLQSDENRLNWLAAQGISTMVFSSHEMLARLKVLRALLSEQEELRRLAGQAETSQRGQLLAEAENATLRAERDAAWVRIQQLAAEAENYVYLLTNLRDALKAEDFTSAVRSAATLARERDEARAENARTIIRMRRTVVDDPQLKARPRD